MGRLHTATGYSTTKGGDIIDAQVISQNNDDVRGPFTIP